MRIPLGPARGDASDCRATLFAMDEPAPPRRDGVATPGFAGEAILAVSLDQLALGLVVEDLMAVVVEEAHVFRLALRRVSAIEQMPHLVDHVSAERSEVPQI